LRVLRPSLLRPSLLLMSSTVLLELSQWDT